MLGFVDDLGMFPGGDAAGRADLPPGTAVADRSSMRCNTHADVTLDVGAEGLAARRRDSTSSAWMAKTNSHRA